VLTSDEWHQGVIGLCASRLCEQFRRPTVLIAIDAERGEAHGSARSIRGFDIYEALKQCSSVLRVFGGHKAAAGFALPAANIKLFMEKFNEIARNELAEEDFFPVIDIDAEIDLRQLSYDVLEEIETLAPFGPANPEPIFSCSDIKLYSAMIVGNNHLKLKIKEEGLFFDAIGFNMGSTYSLKEQTISLAFVPQFNLFNGEKLIQLNLKDIKSI
jgi:single-stranded-DNA-specific exonuclease